MKIKQIWLKFSLILFFSSQNVVANEVSVSTNSLTGPMAMKLAKATYDACTERGYNVAVAVVNRDNRMLAFIRNPLAGVHTIEVSQGKAYTASTFKTPTSKLAGRDFMRDIPGAMIWGGGLPINIAGKFYGGIGVAGAPEKKTPGDVDDECALEGIERVREDIEFGD